MARTTSEYESKETQDWTFADFRDWWRDKVATQDRTNMQRLTMSKLDELAGDPPDGEAQTPPPAPPAATPPAGSGDGGQGDDE